MLFAPEVFSTRNIVIFSAIRLSLLLIWVPIARRLSRKLLKQGYIWERLKSSFRKCYGQCRDLVKQNRSTEGCSWLKRSVDMTSSGKNGLNIRTNASPKWDRQKIWSLLLTYVNRHPAGQPITLTSHPIRLFANFMTFIPNLTFNGLRVVSMEHL